MLPRLLRAQHPLIIPHIERFHRNVCHVVEPPVAPAQWTVEFVVAARVPEGLDAGVVEEVVAVELGDCFTRREGLHADNAAVGVEGERGLRACGVALAV